MKLPDQFLASLTTIKGFNSDSFTRVHESGGQVTSIRLNPLKSHRPEEIVAVENIETRIPWTSHGYYLSRRPSFTFDPLFHAGCYYVQEASSMLVEQALRQTLDLTLPLKVLDLCAAPGGKTTHIQSLISPNSLLVSNEVIRSRASILKDNLVKWGSSNVMVTNNDPSNFSKLPGYFDVLVIDAPCSGSGLFRKEPEAIEEWSSNNVQLCAQRQQRILADAWPALKKEGLLVYATCSYSMEEDEAIVDWIMDTFKVDTLQLSLNESWGIVETKGKGYGYRCWPDKVKGEGFFLACFKKQEGDRFSEKKSKKGKRKAEIMKVKERGIPDRWFKGEGFQYYSRDNTLYAWPEIAVDDFLLLLNELHVIYSGVILGTLVRDKLVPDHALAMTGKVDDTIARLPVDKENAIRFLQKKEMTIAATDKGWQLVTCNAHALGWVNILQNRMNNYYPKELRILKEQQ